MELLLNRYRNITVLVLVLGAQLFLLAYQVKSRQDVRLIRVWAVSSIMPLARVLDSLRSYTIGVVNDYSDLFRAKQDNLKLKESLDALKLENQFLRSELTTADRGRALALFQARTPNRTIAARIIGTGTAGAKVVFVDRGSRDGVMKGMAVITPDGIAGKVTASYPTGSQVVLITDSSFAAGVISQKHRVLGTLKGQGHNTCIVDYIQNEDTVEAGEWFFTSGDDRVFPKGLPAGQVKLVRQGKTFFKEVFLVPRGLQSHGIEDVLIVLEGVHQPIPDTMDLSQPLHLLPPPPAEAKRGMEADRVIQGVMSTDADHLMEKYKRIGNAQGHQFGAGGAPNFNAGNQ